MYSIRQNWKEKVCQNKEDFLAYSSLFLNSKRHNNQGLKLGHERQLSPPQVESDQVAPGPINLAKNPFNMGLYRLDLIRTQTRVAVRLN